MAPCNVQLCVVNTVVLGTMLALLWSIRHVEHIALLLHTSLRDLQFSASKRAYAVELPEKRLLFFAGLANSGVSLLYYSLQVHPDISGILGDGELHAAKPLDVSKRPCVLASPHAGSPDRSPRKALGRSSRARWTRMCRDQLFAFDGLAHLTEPPARLASEHRLRIMWEWRRLWDTSAPVLAEKSPTNLVRLRFLAAVFPSASFVVVLRHPLLVCAAAGRALSIEHSPEEQQGICRCLRHWLQAHSVMRSDAVAAGLEHRLTIVYYEDLVADPLGQMHRVLSGGTLRLRADDVRELQAVKELQRAARAENETTAQAALLAGLSSWGRRVAMYRTAITASQEVGVRPWLGDRHASRVANNVSFIAGGRSGGADRDGSPRPSRSSRESFTATPSAVDVRNGVSLSIPIAQPDAGLLRKLGLPPEQVTGASGTPTAQKASIEPQDSSSPGFAADMYAEWEQLEASFAPFGYSLKSPYLLPEDRRWPSSSVRTDV